MRFHWVALALAACSCCAVVFACSSKGSNAAPAPPDASSDEAGVDAGDGALSPAALHSLAIIGVYEHGGTIDSHGDGVQDTTVTVAPDGTRTIVLTNAKGERQRIVEHSVDEWTLTGDQDGDGKTDERMTSSRAGSVVTRVWERDTNRDGTWGWRETAVTTLGGASRPVTETTVEEWLVPSGGGPRQFVVTSIQNDVNPVLACAPPTPPTPPDPDAGGGDPCWFPGIPIDGASFANQVEPNSLPIVADHGEFRIMTSGPLACDAAKYKTIVDAFNTAIGDGLKRIGDINDGRASLFWKAFAQGPEMIGCGLLAGNCGSPPAAASWPPTKHAFDDVNGSIVTISPTTIARGTDSVVEALLHEWGHNSGFGHQPPPEGLYRDWIYACGRYGAKWLGKAISNAEPSSARDAAMCADDGHKLQFGTQQIEVETDQYGVEKAPGNMDNKPWCATDSMSPPTGQCSCGVMNLLTYCDETPIPAWERSPIQNNVAAWCSHCPAGTPYSIFACPPTGCSTPPPEKWSKPLASSLGDPRYSGCPAVAGAPY